MPPRQWQLRIEDILDAIGKVTAYTAGMTFEQFCGDDRTIDAVVRNLTVIGEAASHVPDDVRARYPELPWAKMRGMRHVVTHEYFGVDLSIVWETIGGNLAGLVPSLRRILAEG